ncbi:hypothetical protein DRN98_07265 [Methanosarcinales archaeon]|nr:hypothetical protein [Candidatus Syntrophoarchaeum sp.]RLG30576.1 MAG: hypothetical protein DRN98_07265 [Methanosarcinales archaeon]
MTKVVIYGGACKFRTEVTILRDGWDVTINVSSECKHCQDYGNSIPSLSFFDLFPERGKPAVGFMENIFYKNADIYLPHVDCPVPCGLLKAIFAEFDLQLKEAPRFEFID